MCGLNESPREVNGRLASEIRRNRHLAFLQDDATFKDILAKIEKERGIKISLEDVGITVLVNARRLEFIGGLNVKLKDMDEIVIMPIIAGGL